MNGRKQRGERGYALAEAMVGGAVLMLAIGGVLAALTQASGHVTRAANNQKATQLLIERVEDLRALPIANPAWDAGVRDCAATLPADLRDGGWSCRITVTDVTGDVVTTPGVVNYKQAQVRVGPRGSADGGGTAWTLETMKW